MKIFFFIIPLFLSLVNEIYASASVSPSLYFMRNSTRSLFSGKITAGEKLSVSIRFKKLPSSGEISDLESQGVTFKRDSGRILKSGLIYLAFVDSDYLELLSKNENIIRIESNFRPVSAPTLDVSAPQVQATRVWSVKKNDESLDGSGVILTDVDTGIDIYHPAFFKPDGGNYGWIDANGSNAFESGVDYVDMNGNGVGDPGETLAFFDASFRDPLGLMERNTGIYDADIDWLYNDKNNSGERDYGPGAGYGENDPSYGELLFIIDDSNKNNRLDPGENLTALGTSRIIAVFDGSGKHYRGESLLTADGDKDNHGTGSCGIAGGQFPGRRLVGVAPGIEFISIDQANVDWEEGLLWAKDLGTDIMMYEFGSWVYEFLDGSSNLEVMINNLYDDGIHQITASGNLAGPRRKKHSRLTVQPAGTDTLIFDVPSSNIKTVYMSLLWRNSILDPQLEFTGPDGTKTTITGDNNEYEVGQVNFISGLDVSPKSTKKMDMGIYSDTAFSGKMKIVIKNKNRFSELTIDAYVADDQTSWMDGTQFQNFLTDDGTVCMPATAEKGITVGAYDPRGTRNTLGDINDFSSWGKTIDGRRVLDITAPGTLVYSLISHDAVGGQPGGYIDFGGTSAALPHVAGCAALIIEASPEILPENLEEVMFSGALTDNFTGSVPNDIWGYGKLRIYDSLLNSNLISTGVENKNIPETFRVGAGYPNPFNSQISFDLSLPNGGKRIKMCVYNIIGEKIKEVDLKNPSPGMNRLIWDGKDSKGLTVSSGLYVFRFNFGKSVIMKKGLFIK